MFLDPSLRIGQNLAKFGHCEVYGEKIIVLALAPLWWYHYHTLPRWLLIGLVVATIAFPFVSEAMVVPPRTDRATILKYAEWYSDFYHVSDRLLFAIIDAESGWNARARSVSSSAKGLLQFLDGSWKYLKCEGDVFNPAHSIECAARTIANGGLSHWLVAPDTARKILPLLSSR